MFSWAQKRYPLRGGLVISIFFPPCYLDKFLRFCTPTLVRSFTPHKGYIRWYQYTDYTPPPGSMRIKSFLDIFCKYEITYLVPTQILSFLNMLYKPNTCHIQHTNYPKKPGFNLYVPTAALCLYNIQRENLVFKILSVCVFKTVRISHRSTTEKEECVVCLNSIINWQEHLCKYC